MAMNLKLYVCSISAVALIYFSSAEEARVALHVENEGFNFKENRSSLNLKNSTEAIRSVRYYLWTLNYYQREEIFDTIDTLEGSHWDSNAPVKVVIHGYMGSGPTGDIKDGYIEDGYPTNVNVLLVDWETLSFNPVYPYVASVETEYVGNQTASMLTFLVKNGYTTPNKIHIIGHSLGAHVAGFAGARFYSNTGSKIGRISGLDPAGPCFEYASPAFRLDPTDALFVDVIHTDTDNLPNSPCTSAFTRSLGIRKQCGHYDVYPNKGNGQNGCPIFDLGPCSHLRSATYFKESINSRNFVSCKCDDDDYRGLFPFNSCNCRKGKAIMGEWTPTSTRGVYSLSTNSRSPFARKDKSAQNLPFIELITTETRQS